VSTAPANLDAEKAVLGGILLDNHAYIESAESLAPEDFSIDSHRRIYRRMVSGTSLATWQLVKKLNPVPVKVES